jgi:hypothetical protein
MALLVVVMSRNYFLKSGETVNKSFIGMGMLTSRTYLSTRFGAVSSSRAKEYLY